LVKKRASQIDEHLELTEEQTTKLMALIRDEFGVKNFTLDINLYSMPKMITINVVDSNFKPLYIKPKNPKILEAMLAFLGIVSYKMKFSER
jgi:hypothetical protein